MPANKKSHEDGVPGQEPGQGPAPADAREIRCEGITKLYAGTPVLDRISVRIPAGSMLGVIGPGGAGKSLLAKIICGLVAPDDGQVFIGDQEVTGLGETSLQELRAGIGMVFQNYALFDFLDVAENIAFPLRMEGRLGDEAIRVRVAEMLEQVALPGIEDKFPHELSGGMKKRVSFARAVVREPPILIYDDPTAGLDPVTSAKIYRLLAHMRRRGTTSLTISHDLDGVRPLCDRWLLLRAGRAVIEGDAAVLDASEDAFVRSFWGTA